MTATPPSPVIPSEVVIAIGQAHVRLLDATAPLSDAQVAAPSRLPGWSRGHVLAHLAGLAAAVSRQVEHARRGEQVDLYDGGQPARDAAIEAGASAPAAAHRRALAGATERIEASLAGLSATDWQRPVRYRDGVVLDLAAAWWREVEIHLTDLDLGASGGGWSGVFCDQLTDFLAERVPAGTRLVLEAPGGWSRVLGAGTALRVAGERADLVGWLAGREPTEPLRVDAGAALPVLGPWPAAHKR